LNFSFRALPSKGQEGEKAKRKGERKHRLRGKEGLHSGESNLGKRRREGLKRSLGWANP